MTKPTMAKPPFVKRQPVRGFSFKFVRVNPSKYDMLNLNRVLDKYKAYCGYTFEMSTSGKKYLKGFIVFPVRVHVDYVRWRLPNYLIDFVKQFDKIEDRLKQSNQTVWINEHPLKPIRTNLNGKFDDAE